MNKPNASRKAEVHSKLKYAKHRHQELMNTLFEAKDSASDPAFLVHTCADIISAARECFDYIGQDIIAAHIIPNTPNPKTTKAFTEGTLKAYFPYYAGQITKADSIYNELKSHSPTLYQDLLDFTSNIASKATMLGTGFNYQMLADVRDMVNEKKHDKLIAVVSDEGAEFLIKNSGVQIILPISGQQGWSSFTVEPGTQVKRVTEYRFAHNGQEAGKFCLFATLATERVIDALYANHFA